MCTRPTPSSGSVTASTHALAVSVVNALEALVLLFAALVRAPLRQFGHGRQPRRPKALVHVDVQVHLGDAACVAELESIVWKTLARAQRTWAPLPLPVDRVVVGAGFPAAGRADIYDDFLQVAEMNAGEAAPQRRVVVSLGVRDGTRDLDGWEIAGALAAQIQALVDERCHQHRSVTAPVAAPASSRLAAPSALEGSVATGTSVGSGDTRIAPAATGSTERPTAEELPSLAELLATVQQGQPLVAAGPTSNGTHP
jgi:hypothetical protein